MNKRQKIVQERFLDDEETIIKRLKQVYNQSQKDINGKISNLDSSIAYLQKALADIGEDEIGDLALAALGSKKQFTPEEAKETLQSMIQSKVYQKNYQTALKKQVGGILDTMQDKEFKLVSDYLNECYENGFVGTMFDLQGQGIPLCFPLDQEAMVRAVQLDSKISKGLYTRLGEDIALLKKKITAQVSRGISTGMSYQQVAQQLAGYTNIGFNNAVRIARTEGHRVQVQSAMDACYKAQEKGADVVKQWDASLDDRTRESHAMVDGEIRELDKPFSNGLMFPGDPDGGAAEVINCRCALLQRAKWALDEDELEELKKRAEFFGLDKSANFEDYKKKYLEAVDKIESNDDITKKSLTNNVKDDIIDAEKSGAIKRMAYPNDFVPATTIEEASKYASDVLHLGQTTAYNMGMNLDVANGVNNAIYRIGNTFGSLTDSGYLEDVTILTMNRGYAAYRKSLHTLLMNVDCMDASAISKMGKIAKANFDGGFWSTGDSMHSVYHELGHAVQQMVLGNNTKKQKQIDVLYNKLYQEVFNDGEYWSFDDPNLIDHAAKAKEKGFSYYGLKNSSEVIAESVAQHFLSDTPSEFAESVIKILLGG